MKVCVLTSRYTATRDIISEDFGRQTRLFQALKKHNHQITMYCADYKKHESKKTTLHGLNVIIAPFRPLRTRSFYTAFKAHVKKGKYDAVIATSDPLWGVIGFHAAKSAHVPFIYDLHDNYEVYKTYRIPFFSYIDRGIIKKAHHITTVSKTLQKKISQVRKKELQVIQNGADLSLFKPMNKKSARKKLNLPQDKKIIVYAGSIQRTQGINVLIDAFTQLKKTQKNLQLVIAGRFFGKEKKYINLEQAGITYLGSLSQKKIPVLINAADVAVVPNTKNSFATYCFPYKIIEYLACNVNIVATDVGEVGLILKNHKNMLCKPSDPKDMAKKIALQLNAKKKNTRKIARQFTWAESAKKLDAILKKVGKNK